MIFLPGSDVKIKLWNYFGDLVKMVGEDHAKLLKGKAKGHDFTHTIMVAQYCLILSDDLKIGVLSWLAGLLHNTDRLFGYEVVSQKVDEYFRLIPEEINIEGSNIQISQSNLLVVKEAILNHSKLNDPSDGLITVILKDSDRLANAGSSLYPRGTQHCGNVLSYNPLYVDGFHPESTYSKAKSVLDNYRYCLEWEEMLRLPRAKEIGEKYFDALRHIIDGFKDQLEETGLYPYPFNVVDD